MFEFARYEGRKRLRPSALLATGMSVLALLVVWAFPSFRDAMDVDEILDAYPEPLLKLFRVEEMGTLEGFLAAEFYVFGWVILLSLYVAYSTAGVVADDVDRGRMDTLLAMPVSRPRLVAEKFLAAGVPIVVVNAVVAPVVLAGSYLIDEPLSELDVVALHALSIPFLYACAGIGLVASVVFDRASVAQRVAMGLTFALYLVESLLAETDYEALGAVSPMRYFDPNGVLVDGTYDLFGAAVLVVATLALLVASQAWFTRRDV